MSQVGHNSVDGPQIRAFLERIEKLEEEKKAVADDIKEVYVEAKGSGYDTAILRKIVALRKQDKSKREAEAAVLDLYLSAIGWLTP